MPLVAMTREMGSLGKDVAAGIAARANKKVVYQEIIGFGALGGIAAAVSVGASFSF